MSKHTPGPWETFKEHNVRDVHDHRGVATCGGYSQNWNEDIVYQENIANARLIAAAPELLEAAKDVVETFPDIKLRKNSIDARRRLEKAIKKAEGSNGK
jgi:hypothetical protein